MNLTFLITAVASVAAVFGVGFYCSRLKAELSRAKEFSNAQALAVEAMKQIVKNSDEMQKLLDRISHADTADALNKLYEEIISGPTRPRNP